MSAATLSQSDLRISSGIKQTVSKYGISTRTELLRKAKEINIPVHGTVSLTMMAKCFIDNRYFQRLKGLKQLGTCEYIFPGATHTRFEHSIGTYYLADRITTRIKSASDNCKMMEWLVKIKELESQYASNTDNIGSGFNNWIIELIKIAALCHDIGHGPYSHLFDDVFIKNSKYHDHPMATHESRSCAMIELIVKESDILSRFMTSDDIKFIQSLIDPPSQASGFVYQIVSNNLNGLDVDKYDYINRDALHTGVKSGFDCSKLVDSVLVIDDNIVYPEQAVQDIYSLFVTRHAMHRRVYGHKGVVSAQCMIIDIMKILDKVISIADSVLDMDKFIRLDDNYIITCMNLILEMRDMKENPYKDKLTIEDYDNLSILRDRCQSHNLYTHIDTILTQKDLDFGDEFKTDKHVVFRSKVGYASGNKLNPLDRVYVYKTMDHFINGHNVKARRINKTDITYIIPNTYQEHVTMVFRKEHDIEGIRRDKEILQTIKDKLFSN
jgi:HD superfamily phosphohydrolase